jgi:hypothetical protein
MDKTQKQLVDTYYRKRAIAVGMARGRYGYKPYEFSDYALNNKIMSFEKLSISEKYEIYSSHKDSRVRNAVLPLIEAYNKDAAGMLRIILDYNETGNSEQLHTFIVGSDFIKENNATDDVEIRGDIVYIGVNENDLINAIGIGDEYSYISSTAGGYYGGGYTDSSESDYMWNNLNGENKNKILAIAGKLGVSKNVTDKFQEEGKLGEFFEKYDMEKVTEYYLSEYGEAKDDAEQEEARKQMESIPIDIERQLFDVDKVLKYLYRYDLKNINTFDEFLSAIYSHNELNQDSINEAGYNHMDLTELDRVIGSELDDILNELDDPSNERYIQVEAVRDLQNAMKQYGFTVAPEPHIIGLRKQKDKKIAILAYQFDPDGYEDENFVEIEIALVYPDGKKRQGWIPLSNLKNYIDQPELPNMSETST